MIIINWKKRAANRLFWHINRADNDHYPKIRPEGKVIEEESRQVSKGYFIRYSDVSHVWILG